MKNLKDKVVLITGGGSGIGRATALELARKGAHLVLADINEAGMAESEALINAAGGQCECHVLDVSKKDSWESLASKLELSHGGLDVLINNAGVLSRAESFLELDDEHCRFIFEINFWGMFYGVRSMTRLLAKRPEAHIVNLSSSLALIGSPMHSIYCASKAAVRNYTEVMREELSATKIAVTLVYPGASKTNLGRNVQIDDVKKREENAMNFDRFASTTPEAVAHAIVDGIRHKRRTVVTGMDGKALGVMSRVSPSGGYRLMAAAYRKVADAQLFAALDGLGKAK